MSTPTPGQPYTTKSGEDLRNVAARAYGDPEKSTLIFNANNFAVTVTDQNTVATGTVLNIPKDAVFDQLRKKQRRG